MRFTGVIISLFVWFLPLVSLAQDSAAMYRHFVVEADSLYNARQYLRAAGTYHTAFGFLNGKGYTDDRYNAAKAWAMSKEKDSVFFNLMRIANIARFDKYFELKNEPDLENLHMDDRWQGLLDTVKKNQLESYANYKVALCVLLDSMEEVDQRCRHNITRFDNYGDKTDTATRRKLGREVGLVDSGNFILLQRIYKRYGYVGYNLGNIRGSNNFWLLVQHQDKHPEFQDSVLVKMKIEVENGNASKTDFAYLTDRVRVNTNRLQVYGTQMILNTDKTSYEPKPCIDMDGLNERRKSMGLSPIEEYTEGMNKRYFGTLKKK